MKGFVEDVDQHIFDVVKLVKQIWDCMSHMTFGRYLINLIFYLPY